MSNTGLEAPIHTGPEETTIQRGTGDIIIQQAQPERHRLPKALRWGAVGLAAAGVLYAGDKFFGVGIDLFPETTPITAIEAESALGDIELPTWVPIAVGKGHTESVVTGKTVCDESGGFLDYKSALCWGYNTLISPGTVITSSTVRKGEVALITPLSNTKIEPYELPHQVGGSTLGLKVIVNTDGIYPIRIGMYTPDTKDGKPESECNPGFFVTGYQLFTGVDRCAPDQTTLNDYADQTFEESCSEAIEPITKPGIANIVTAFLRRGLPSKFARFAPKQFAQENSVLRDLVTTEPQVILEQTVKTKSGSRTEVIPGDDNYNLVGIKTKSPADLAKALGVSASTLSIANGSDQCNLSPLAVSQELKILSDYGLETQPQT